MTGLARFSWVLTGVTICNTLIAFGRARVGWALFDCVLVAILATGAWWAEA